MFYWPYYWLYCCYKQPPEHPPQPQPGPQPSPPSLPELTEAIENYLNSPRGKELLARLGEEYINKPEQQARIRSWLRQNLPELLRSPGVRTVLREIVRDILNEGQPLG